MSVLFGEMMNLQFLLKVLRYGGGSLLAVGADVGLMLVLAQIAKFPYLYAAAIGFFVGSIVKYLVSKFLVYDDNRGDDKSLSILLFALISLSGLLLNHIIIYVGVGLLGAHLLLAKLFSAGFVFVMNFFLMGWFVFKDPLYKNSSDS